MRMQTVTSKPRIFKAEFNLNKRFFQTSNSQQVALDNHLFQWSRRHASDFESGVGDLRCADATRPCQETQAKVR